MNCAICNKALPPKPPNTRGVPSQVCSPECNKERNRLRCEAKRRADPEAHRRSVARYRERHPERIAAYKKRSARRIRSYRLEYDYGITLEEFERMLYEQGGCCAICGATSPSGRRNQWYVDHDHKTGLVRGALCCHCNLMLGAARDVPQTLIRAASYLQRQLGA
jgi:hypothetical protein